VFELQCCGREQELVVPLLAFSFSGVRYMGIRSGVTRGLSQEGKSLGEGGPLAKTKKKLINDNEFLNVHTR